MATEKPTGLAYHHAAHAVLAREYGVPFDRVTLIADADRRSREHLPERCNPDALSLEDLEDHIMVALAGPLAEHRTSPASSVGLQADQDMSIVNELASAVTTSPEAQAALITSQRLRASDLIDAYWHDVEAVAEALAQRLELTYTEVKQVLLDHLNAEPAKRGEPPAI